MPDGIEYDTNFTLEHVGLEHPVDWQASLVNGAINDAWRTEIDDKGREEWASQSKILADEVLRLRYTVQQEREIADRAMKIKEEDISGRANVHIVEALVQVERAKAYGKFEERSRAISVAIEELRLALGMPLVRHG
ncbi:MAG TPA: hypothetical protein VGH72_33500 [Pseudonocardia sp.]|jgi:hypothetical protein